MDRSLLKKIIFLGVPAVIEFAMRTMVGYVDYFMVGSLGAAQTAAIGLTSEVVWMSKAGMNALSIGVTAYIAARLGEKRDNDVRGSVRQAFYLSIVIGVFTTVLCLALANPLPVLLGADKELIKPAATYFFLVSTPMLFFSINTVFGSVLKAGGDMITPLVVNGLMNIINVILNLFLIFPDRQISFFGVKMNMYGAGLGINGAAIGTVIATVFGGAAMLYAVLKRDRFNFRGSPASLDRNIIRAFVAVGIPSFLSSVLMCGGRVIFTALIARLGTIQYASHTLAFTSESLFYIPCIGLGTAITTLAGNARGEGSREKLNQLAKYSCVLVFLVMSLMSLIMYINAEAIIAFISSDSGVREIAPGLLRIVALNEPFFGISVIMEGIFNGIGRTKYTLGISAFSQWFCRVSGTFIFVHMLGGSIYTAWYCMIGDNICRALLFVVFFIKNNHKVIEDNNLSGKEIGVLKYEQ